MIHKLILFFIITVDLFLLYFQTFSISISSVEASILYETPSYLTYIEQFFIYIFGQNDFALRFPMILFHLFSVLLMYEISKYYIKSDKNRLWLILIFVSLPGVVSSAIIVNSAGILIFGLLLFVYLYLKSYKILYLSLLFFYSLLDGGFIYLFISLIFYFYNNFKTRYALYSLVLTILSLYIHGSGVFGLPKGHFLDAIGVYSAIFTPIIFIYIFYTIYRKYLTKDIDILWYISSTALIISLVLSFRQRVSLEYFAPYLLISLPFVAKQFISSYRVRLKEYRTSYRLAFIFSLIFLFINTIAVFLNKFIFLYIEIPEKHFAYKSYIAKELAMNLKKENIRCIDTNKEMQLRLKFYKIDKCDKYHLNKLPYNDKNDTNVTISYMNKVVYKATVTKLNNK